MWCLTWLLQDRVWCIQEWPGWPTAGSQGLLHCPQDRWRSAQVWLPQREVRTSPWWRRYQAKVPGWKQGKIFTSSFCLVKHKTLKKQFCIQFICLPDNKVVINYIMTLMFAFFLDSTKFYLICCSSSPYTVKLCVIVFKCFPSLTSQLLTLWTPLTAW